MLDLGLHDNRFKDALQEVDCLARLSPPYLPIALLWHPSDKRGSGPSQYIVTTWSTASMVGEVIRKAGLNLNPEGIETTIEMLDSETAPLNDTSRFCRWGRASTPWPFWPASG